MPLHDPLVLDLPCRLTPAVADVVLDLLLHPEVERVHQRTASLEVHLRTASSRDYVHWWLRRELSAHGAAVVDLEAR